MRKLLDKGPTLKVGLIRMSALQHGLRGIELGIWGFGQKFRGREAPNPIESSLLQWTLLLRFQKGRHQQTLTLLYDYTTCGVFSIRGYGGLL